MIKVHVDIDLEAKELCSNRTVEVGTTFPICLCIEHASLCPTPIVFDTIILEVFFNDSHDVLIRVDPDDRPLAMDLASNSEATIDFFSREKIRGGDYRDLKTFGGGSFLSLYQNPEEPFGLFRGRTGRAALADFENPFVLEAGAPPISVAMGKANAGLTARDAGTSTLIATGFAFYKNYQIPLVGASSIVNIIPK